MLVCILFVAGLGFVYWREHKAIEQAKAELLVREAQAASEKTRRLLEIVAEECVAAREFGRTVAIEERLEAAFAAVAGKNGVSVPELHQRASLYVTWVRASASATPEDQALAAIVENKFADAMAPADKAAQAVHNFRVSEEKASEEALQRASTAGSRLRVRLTANADASAASERARAARSAECVAWILTGNVEGLARQPKAAAAAYQNALDLLDEKLEAVRRCDVMQFLATALFEQNLAEEAESTLRKAVESRAALIGLALPANILGLQNLAVICQSRRDDAAAEPVLRTLVQALEPTRGPEHLDTLDAVTRLGRVLLNRGKFGDAEACFRRVLEVQDRTVIEDDPGHLSTLNNLATALTQKGDNAGAESFYRRVADARERTLGPDDPSTLVSVNNLAALLTNKRDYEHAEPLFRKVFESHERTLGVGHATTLAAAYSLAVMLQNKGDANGVKVLYQGLMTRQEQALGPDHPATLQSASYLASQLRNTKNYAEAEPLIRRVLTTRERLLGPEHSDTLSSVKDLAYLDQAKGDYAAAEPLWQRVLKAEEHTLGKEDRETVSTVQNLANLLLIMGRDAAAEPLYQRALDSQERIFGKAHPATALTAYGFSGLRRRQGKLRESLTLAQEAVDAARVCLPVGDRNRVLYEQQLVAVQGELAAQGNKPPGR